MQAIAEIDEAERIRHAHARTATVSGAIPDSDSIFTALMRTFDDAADAPSIDWLERSTNGEPRVDVRSFSPAYRRFRRIRDIVLASLLLTILSPLLLVVAVLVKLTSPGPVIYRQVRVGLNLRRGDGDRRRQRMHVSGDRRSSDRRRVNAAGTVERAADDAFGRPFVIYKFRTMRSDAERNGARFAEANDARVTWIGRFLRRTRIDELPQLWNVLRGDMSMIGPRPERPEFVAKFAEQIPEYPLRLRLEPGLTGIAQVVNGYDNDLAGFRRKVLYDLLYLHHGSLRNDNRILLRTIRVVLTGEGAL